MTQLRQCIHGDPIERGTLAWFKSLNWLDEMLSGQLPRGSSLSDVDGIITEGGNLGQVHFYDNDGAVLFIETKRPGEGDSAGQKWGRRSLSSLVPQSVYVLIRGESEEGFLVAELVGLTSWANPLRALIPVDGWVDADVFAKLVLRWWEVTSAPS